MGYTDAFILYGRDSLVVEMAVTVLAAALRQKMLPADMQEIADDPRFIEDVKRIYSDLIVHNGPMKDAIPDYDEDEQ